MPMKSMANAQYPAAVDRDLTRPSRKPAARNASAARTKFVIAVTESGASALFVLMLFMPPSYSFI